MRLNASNHGEPAFEPRHTAHDPKGVAEMLATVGVGTVEELVAQTVPAAIRLTERLDIDDPASETEALSRLRAIAGRNEIGRSLIGMGYYGTITPPVVLRNVLENPAWYTAYTPYQPEISQGRLEALLNFQTMIAEITGQIGRAHV